MNGAQARIWTNKWITNIQGGALCHVPSAIVDRNAIVETIIDWNSRSWNLDIIRPLLSTQEALAIQRIPIGSILKVDHLVWPDEKNGKYSVRSGYHNIHTHHHHSSLRRPSSSMSIDQKGLEVDLARGCHSKNSSLLVESFKWPRGYLLCSL
ncbi:unnamed protein product [Prunus brigantina]